MEASLSLSNTEESPHEDSSCVFKGMRFIQELITQDKLQKVTLQMKKRSLFVNVHRCQIVSANLSDEEALRNKG